MNQKPAIHRIAAGTPQARMFMASHQKKQEHVELSAEVIAHNAEIERKKQMKKAVREHIRETFGKR